MRNSTPVLILEAPPTEAGEDAGTKRALPGITAVGPEADEVGRATAFEPQPDLQDSVGHAEFVHPSARVGAKQILDRRGAVARQGLQPQLATPRPPRVAQVQGL